MRSEGFEIFATKLSEKSVGLYDIDFTKKIAFILGNEHRGVSEEAVSIADRTFYIPMHGMVESLNVSVAAAVILYEAQRQRLLSGQYRKSELEQKEIDELIDKWCRK